MSRRRSRSVAVAAMAGLLLLAVPGGAVAGNNTVITLDSLASGETFVATGGVICPEGTATTDFKKFGGSDNSRAGSFHLTKTLECADGSGTFTIVVNAATVFGSPGDQGGWAVLDGTDDYASLRGGGQLVGTYVEDGIIDTYTGSLRK
ncbi:MAG TPA: hypothetical protein VFV72_08550 [Candidatus Limnocylindrales bacterium]|nr:hypothetical protein [Candidatus Limnocylindrales bacterium]